MLDLEIPAHFLYHFIIQFGVIVSNDLPRESVPTNQLPLYESDHYTPRDIGVGSRFDPFGEIIYCHENEAMTVRSLGFDGPYDVYPPHGKMPRGGHDIQRMWGSIDIVRERLTFMAFPYMGAAIAFHGELLITCSKDLLGHSMPIGMRSKRTLVDFLDHVVRLLGIHASQEGHVMFSLV